MSTKKTQSKSSIQGRPMLDILCDHCAFVVKTLCCENWRMSMNPALVLALALTASAPPASPWLTDYAAAVAVARKTNKPLFVVVRCPQ